MLSVKVSRWLVNFEHEKPWLLRSTTTVLRLFQAATFLNEWNDQFPVRDQIVPLTPATEPKK